MLPEKILTKRPDLMDQETFKRLRSEQNKAIKAYLRWGKQAWTSVAPVWYGELGEKLPIHRYVQVDGTFKRNQ